jgi:rod shape-determining protein MreC
MKELFLILKRFSHVFLFILFESLALIILFQKNDYHRPLAVNALQRMSYNYYSRVNRLREYFALRETNRQLAEENARCAVCFEAPTATREKGLLQWLIPGNCASMNTCTPGW